MDKINVADAFGRIHDYWNPRIAGELNGQLIKLVKFKGAFVWHKHELEDEMFLVTSGQMIMELRDRTIRVDPGEFIIIPKGVEHKPVAEEETCVILFEPASTLNTGDVRNQLTREHLERI